MAIIRVYVDAGPQLASMPPRLVRLQLALLASMIWDLAVAGAAAEHDPNPEP